MRLDELNEFKLKIIGPYETTFQGNIVSLVAKTPHGKVGILAQHAPYLGVLTEGTLDYTFKNGERKNFEIDGGLLKVKDNKATVVYF